MKDIVIKIILTVTLPIWLLPYAMWLIVDYIYCDKNK